MGWKTFGASCRGRIALLALAVLAASGAEAAESRCGWVDNPTPGNWSLTDREGEWTIGAQGGFQAEGADLIPDLTGKNWVETNGSYGYGCACMTVETSRRSMRILEIQGVVQLPISKCRKDSGLPRR